MRAFLSIDLDYWNETTVPFKWLDDLFASFKNKSLILDHDDILPHLNPLNCSDLVNIDWHSDLGGYSEGKKLPPLNCGTWVDWVQWKSTNCFTWIHPNSDCAKTGGSGRCEGDDSINAFELGRSIWKRVHHFNGGVKPRLPQFNYVGISICLSPDYIETGSPAKDAQIIKWFIELGQKHKLLSSSQIEFCDKIWQKWVKAGGYKAGTEVESVDIFAR